MAQRFERIAFRLRKHICVLGRAESRNYSKDSQGESEIADAVCNKRLPRRVCCLLAAKVISN